MALVLLLACLLAVFSNLGVSAQKENCAKGMEFAYDLEDCNRFYTCVGPLAYHMVCSPGLIFSLEKKGCVFESDEKAQDCLTKAAKLAYAKAIEEFENNMVGDGTTGDDDENKIEKKEKKMKKEMDKEVDSNGKKIETNNEKTNKPNNGNTDEANNGKTDEANNGNTDEANNGNTDEANNGKTDEANNGNTDEANNGNTDEANNGNTDEANNGNTDEEMFGAMDINELMDQINGLDAEDFNSFVQDLGAIQDNTDDHCTNSQGIKPHETLCHRYYNCSMSHMNDMNRYLTPYEYECPYPQLFSADTLSCQDFQTVNCGDRMEYLDPCDYAENMCSGPNCKPCSIDHASCADQPDGSNYWPGREGSGFWVDCLKGRTMAQGNCVENDPTMRNIFSKTLRKCVPYSDVIPEVCQWSERRLPHPYECHLFYDCDAHGDDADDDAGDNDADGSVGDQGNSDKAKTPAPSSSQYIRMCPYPMLYSVRAGKCMDHLSVKCGTRREAKTPCDYMPTECVDPSYASCEGLPDGKNVFRTREGTPHFVICENERTIEKDMCKMDDRGMYKQFSPGTGKCMDV